MGATAALPDHAQGPLWADTFEVADLKMQPNLEIFCCKYLCKSLQIFASRYIHPNTFIRPLAKPGHLKHEQRMNGCDFTLSGTQLTALGSGALWWPEQSLLCISDLHLGKSERIARRGGAALPPYDTRDTLTRLAADLALSGAPVLGKSNL